MRAMNDHTSTRPHAIGHELELLTIAEAEELVRAPVAALRCWRHRGTGPSSLHRSRLVV